MQVVAPSSRLRRGVRRLATAICAIVLGAGFTPALPSTVEPARPAPVSLSAPGAAPQAESAVEETETARVVPAAAPGFAALAQPLPAGRHAGAVTGRAPPAHPV
ncbi:hypothetical protein [Dactylosporangium sp. CA-233914]|uniref:hypothetical protein n=1 Tax=Dactylosporangium sp. CA-233914 TaxID=3239934 RepID=UPI003D8E9EB7